MNYTEAIDNAYHGKKVRRSGWVTGWYIFADKGYLYTCSPDKKIEDHQMDKDEFYATDWGVVE